MRSLAALLTICMACASAYADVFTNVPEAAGMELVYDLTIPATSGGWHTTAVPYSVDRAGQIADPFDRVAYYLELDGTWVYVETAPFTTQLDELGVPHAGLGVQFQQLLTDVRIRTNAPGIAAADNLATANIEFWPGNYSPPNVASVPGASDTIWDFGDTPGGPTAGYASMQIHNHGAQQTLFAYNRWGGAGVSDLGLGNHTGDNPDWTFALNAGDYTARRLQVLVRTVTPTVHDRVSAASDYETILAVSIPAEPGGFHARPVPYWIDRRTEFERPFDRVAYYMELNDGGGPRWAFVSMPAFTEDLDLLGLPTADTGADWRIAVADMQVAGNAPGVTTGDGLSGNLEFWPNNYVPAAAGVPGASDTLYDIGDTPSAPAAGYGSLQIHNTAAAETIMAWNRWGPGGAGLSDLGLGNHTGDNPDWTFAQNADDYTTRQLYVLVRPMPELDAELSESGGDTSVAEGGPADTLSLALSRAPSASVTVTLTPSVPPRGPRGPDLDLGSGGGRPHSIVIDPADWQTPRTIDIQAVDDTRAEVAEIGRIEIRSSSADASFDHCYLPPVDVRIEDNDGTPTLHIFLLGGQSNMVGLGKSHELTGELAELREDIPFFFGSQWGPLRSGSGIEFGPELTFGRELVAARPDDYIALVKYSVGGTNLHTQWAPPAGPMYVGFSDTVTQAHATLRAQLGDFAPHYAGMIWMQGESDSVAPHHLAYEQNLTEFIARIRADVGEAELPFVIGQISEHPAWTEGATIRQVQADVAAADPWAGLVITVDLPLIPGDVHYDTEGNLELGRRFAAEMLRLLALRDTSARVQDAWPMLR